jgi:hypothetical protein
MSASIHPNTNYVRNRLRRTLFSLLEASAATGSVLVLVFTHVGAIGLEL